MHVNTKSHVTHIEENAGNIFICYLFILRGPYQTMFRTGICFTFKDHSSWAQEVIWVAGNKDSIDHV